MAEKSEGKEVAIFVTGGAAAGAVLGGLTFGIVGAIIGGIIGCCAAGKAVSG